MELLLCNQAVISHHQPITKISFLKQFVYRETYKSWLTLQGKLHWVGSRQRARASSQVLYWSHWCWQGGQLVALSQVGKSSLPRQRGVSSAGSVILCTFLYGMGVFPEITVTNSNDEPSLPAGIFPKRFCLLEVGTDLQEGYLIALTTPFPLQWTSLSPGGLSAGVTISEKPQTPRLQGKLLPAGSLFLPKWK